MPTIFHTSLSLPIIILLAYLLSISLITFLYFGFDKARSFHPGARRIRERTLWILSLIGGTPGALLAMHFFRHKTKKNSFQGVMILILLAQLSCIFLLLYYSGL